MEVDEINLYKRENTHVNTILNESKQNRVNIWDTLQWIDTFDYIIKASYNCSIYNELDDLDLWPLMTLTNCDLTTQVTKTNGYALEWPWTLTLMTLTDYIDDNDLDWWPWHYTTGRAWTTTLLSALVETKDSCVGCHLAWITLSVCSATMTLGRGRNSSPVSKSASSLQASQLTCGGLPHLWVSTLIVI